MIVDQSNTGVVWYRSAMSLQMLKRLIISTLWKVHVSHLTLKYEVKESKHTQAVHTNKQIE